MRKRTLIVARYQKHTKYKMMYNVKEQTFAITKLHKKHSKKALEITKNSH